MSTPASRSSARAVVAGSLATLGLTAAHHLYGGVRYATAWRTHGAVVALALGGVVLWLAARHRRGARAAGWALVALALVVPVLAVGAFEGFYNHLVKNLLYLGHAPEGVLRQLFPPPTYEPPNDLWFEVSGVAQVIPAAVVAIATWRFAASLRGPAAGRLAVGATIAPRTVLAVTGEAIAVPDPARLVHLQFRRFAGCPVCHLHLQTLARRLPELARRGVREVVVFHTGADELRLHASLPFPLVADPDQQLYRAFGVEASPRALLDPRAWPAIVRGVARSTLAIVRGRERAPALRPHGGRLGLPADFLIGPNGRLLARHYGAHADDQWSVDEVLARLPT